MEVAELWQVVASALGPLARGHNMEIFGGWPGAEAQSPGSGQGHHSSAWYTCLLPEKTKNEKEAKCEVTEDVMMIHF